MGKFYLPVSRATLILILLTASAASLFSQRTITGTVTDAHTNEGLIGANVVVKGATVGTVTDFDGAYTLTVPQGFDIVVFSYTGYNSQEIRLTASNAVNVALDHGQFLEEVVLIGYGTVKREDVTGTLQSVSSENFNRGAITGAQELLSGKIAGVVITTSNGAPGEGAAIRIRGESSLSASNDPLIVIDGVPIDNGGISGGRNPLNVINPNDIETFTVLKDASAAAIYGNRAAAGVILITTKKGKAYDKIRIGYNGNVSSGRPIHYVDVLNAEEYRALIASRFADSTHQTHSLLGEADTDWQKEIYQNAIGHDHNLYASGGIGSVPYRVSLGYTYKDGILKTDNFNRITAGLNLNPGFLDNTLQLNFHLKTMFTNNQFAAHGAIGNAINFDPTQAVRDPESVWGGFTTWLQNDKVTPNNVASPINPVALLELRDDHSKERRYILNLATDYRFWFLPDLRANLNIAYDYSEGNGTVVVPTNAAFAYNADTGGGTNNSYEQEKENSLLEFYLNYRKTIERHSLDIMGGYSWQHFFENSASVNSDFNGVEVQRDSMNIREYYLVSFFGRANYSFKNRFLLTLTIRQDGTSKFSPKNRWGLFPAAALGVKIIDNERTTFNNLKFRAGWGITGQQEIGDYYAYLARYTRGNEFAQYQFGENFYRTSRPDGYDVNIKWEETETYNLGLDFSIIRNRLSGSVDLYRRYTTDLLNEIPPPAGSNLRNSILTNVGNMENQGIEVSFFTTPVKTNKITWDFAVNAAYNKNKITKLTVFDDPEYQGVPTGGIFGGVGSTIQIHSVGYAPRAFYVYQQLYDENGHLLEAEFADLNGDSLISLEEDRYRFVKPAPDYTIGFTSRLAIGNFDFSFAGRASIGNYVYNNVQTDGGYLSRLYLSTGGPTLWNVPQSAVDLGVINQSSLTFSDHFVKPADFLKIDHITIGYNFNKLIGEYLRLYFTAQSPIILTRYDGLDPEIFDGLDKNFYARPRTFLFGLNVEF